MNMTLAPGLRICQCLRIMCAKSSQQSIRLISSSTSLLSNERQPKIYTRTGDKGTSATFTGERRPKDDAIFEALGTTDELTSAIGHAMEFCEDSGQEFTSQLEKVQCVLQEVSSSIATPKGSARERHLELTSFDKRYVEDLEKWIDQYTKQLPPLKSFILPSGGKCATSLHVARSVCRRAERRVTTLVRAGDVDGEPLRYLNRLSDFLFTVARFAAQTDKKSEKIYERIYPDQDS